MGSAACPAGCFAGVVAAGEAEGAGLRHLPSTDPKVNAVWMWAAILTVPGRVVRHARALLNASAAAMPVRVHLAADGSASRDGD